MNCLVCNTNLEIKYHKKCLENIMIRLHKFIVEIKKSNKKKQIKISNLQKQVEQQIKILGSSFAVWHILFVVCKLKSGESPDLPEQINYLSNKYNFSTFKSDEKLNSRKQLLEWKKFQIEKIRKENESTRKTLNDKMTFINQQALIIQQALLNQQNHSLLLQNRSLPLQNLESIIQQKNYSCRQRLIELALLFPVIPISTLYYSIGIKSLEFYLPCNLNMFFACYQKAKNNDDVKDEDIKDEDVKDDNVDREILEKITVDKMNAAIGLFGFIINLIAKYYFFTLPFTINFKSSKSTISNRYTKKDYPLFFENENENNTIFGLRLLANNIFTMCAFVGIQIQDEMSIMKNTSALINYTSALINYY